MATTKLKNQTFEILVFICLILVGFKLSGSIIAIDWSWWLVLSPLSLLVLNYAILGCVILYKLSASLNHHHDKERAFIK